MVKKKDIDKKDNIIFFPSERIKRTGVNTPVIKESIKREHNKIYAQNFCDEITSKLLVSFHSENIDVTKDTFLKDYKLLAESLKSLLLRSLKQGHPLQAKVDKAVKTTKKGQSIFGIMIDYNKL